MRKVYGLLLAGALACGVSACDEQLVVPNKNSPDQDRALTRPTDVEALIQGSYNTQFAGTYLFGGVAPQIMCLGMENYSNLANSAMGVRSGIPRPPIANTRNAGGTAENYPNFVRWHRAARTAALGLNRVNRSDFTFFPTSATQTERSKAFAHFVIAISMGQLAMVYDSASIIGENDDLTASTALPFAAYDSVARYSLARLDSALAHAVAMGTQTIPTTWMSTATALTSAQFQGYIRGWKARIRAGVIRTPTDAAAVTPAEWTLLLNDANAFIAQFSGTAPDFITQMNPANGWDVGVMNQLYQSQSQQWHVLHGFIMGMADTSGGYQAWLGTAAGSRAPYPIATPDRRFPNGGATCNVAAPMSAAAAAACRTAQQTAAAGAFQWVENRPADWSGDDFASSMYRVRRFLPWFLASRIAPYPTMPTAEIRMLAAEAHLRLGAITSAASLIDSTRVVRGGLPAIGSGAGAITTLVQTVPGGSSCVPRVAVATGGVFATSCGTIWEALKWEKRLETMYTYMGTWYFDARRWGDLPEGTPIHFPIPYQEMDTRGITAFYGTGGVGATTGTPKGTYGF